LLFFLSIVFFPLAAVLMPSFQPSQFRSLTFLGSSLEGTALAVFPRQSPFFFSELHFPFFRNGGRIVFFFSLFEQGRYVP